MVQKIYAVATTLQSYPTLIVFYKFLRQTIDYFVHLVKEGMVVKNFVVGVVNGQRNGAVGMFQ